MTTAMDLLLDGFTRVRENVHATVTGLSTDQLAERVGPDSNTIAWLVWHLARVEDDHIADLAGTEQVWTRQGWAQQLDLPFADSATGFGQSTRDVAQVRLPADLLEGYYDAVHEQTVGFLTELTDGRLSDVIDDSWDPPVTVAVRLVSVLGDTTQHIGQAAFVRGIVKGS